MRVMYELVTTGKRLLVAVIIMSRTQGRFDSAVTHKYPELSRYLASSELSSPSPRSPASVMANAVVVSAPPTGVRIVTPTAPTAAVAISPPTSAAAAATAAMPAASFRLGRAMHPPGSLGSRAVTVTVAVVTPARLDISDRGRVAAP